MTAMFPLLKTLFLFLNADAVTHVLSEYGGRVDTNDVTVGAQSRNRGAEDAEVLHETPFRGKHSFIHIQSNCTSRSSQFNITTVQGRATLVSFSYTGSDERGDVASFRCWVHMTSPSNTVMSLLRLDRKCSGRGFILVSDMQSQKRWRLCPAVWFAPGLDFTTSSSAANVTIAVKDVTVSYTIDINVQMVSKPSGKELEVRYLSATQGYIQTPGWNPEDATTYPSDMDSWVSIPVPRDHKVIVTVIDMDTEDSETCQYDWLELFLLLQQDLDAGTTTANVPSPSTTMPRQDTAKMDDDTPTSDRKTDQVDSWNHGGTPNRTKHAAGPNLAYAQPTSKSKVYTEKDAFHTRTFKASEHYGGAAKASTDRRTTMTFSRTTRGDSTETKPKRAWRTCGSRRPDVVMAEASVVHVNFHSDASRQHTGARIFFSFHKASRSPDRLPNGKWNCSVPHWSDFRLHFVCNFKQNCEGGEDEQDCPYRRCQHSGMAVSGRCYFHLKPNTTAASWNDAQLGCRKSGADLASLTSPNEWYDVVYWLRANDDGRQNVLYVGLASVTSQLPHMYRRLLQWNDGTIGYFLKYTTFRKPPICAVLSYVDKIASLWQCHTSNEYGQSYYLCEKAADGEIAQTPVDRQRQVVQIQTPVRQKPPLPHVVCPLGHMTHELLACDAHSYCWGQVDVIATDDRKTSTSSSCGAPLTSTPPSFACASGADRVPYSMVCDHSRDCLDSSDEDFCHFDSCFGGTQFECSSKQCVSGSSLCNQLQDCRDGSDEEQCDYQSSVLVFSSTPPPAVVHFDGRGNYSYQPMADFSHCPETHFQCQDDGYCLPVYVRCNGVYDCPDREDEEGCDSYVCPGFYRCRGSSVCLHVTHVCDGWPQCSQFDDERFCDLTCPDGCVCYGHAFTCTRTFPVSRYPQLRYLDASDSGLQPGDLEDNYLLVHLSLARCGLRSTGKTPFPNLRSVDLSNNNIQSINTTDFHYFPKMQSLSLAGNPLISLRDLGFESSTKFVSVLTLDLSFVELPDFDPRHLRVFPKLRSLNLSHSNVKSVRGEGFRPLTSLQMLDVRECPMTSIPKSMFRGLVALRRVFADNYKLCCPAMLPEGFIKENCKAPFDEISSCEALLQSDLYRISLSVFAALSILGNTFSFVFRIFVLRKGNKSGFAVFVTHLCVADFLMGVYLAVIGVADRVYLGSYLWEEVSWKSSVACKVAGFLSLLSSEVSAFIICLVTVDRFLVLRFPFSRLHFQRRSARVACGLVWTVGVVIAAVPLLPVTSHWSFYSQTGICLPLPVTRQEDFPGHDYAFGVMIVFNFVLFLFIAAGQISIYAAVRTQSMSGVDRTSQKSKDLAVARRLLTIVLSDFLCWFPIGLLGLLASLGTVIPGEVNVGMAIFALPLNSAINPFLYTLNMIQERRIRAREEKLLKTVQLQMQVKTTGTKEDH